MPTRLDDLVPRSLPRPPGFWAALGPGIVWMALAQGSGELYYWPYFVAKYGALYLCLLIPASILQMPVNVEIGRYTMLTGESVFTGFVRLNRRFGAFLWIYFALCFVFISGWANMGATALKDVIDWPAGWDPAARTRLWSGLIVTFFAASLFVGRVAYRLIERFMLVVAVITLGGLSLACLQPEVSRRLPEFLAALVPATRPRAPDPADMERFLTMICYSGLGGFWSLFYSFWIREKGFGMAAYAGHITSPLTGKPELISFEGYRFEDSPEHRAAWGVWMRRLVADNAVGVIGNLITTALMALLAFALLHPKGLVPTGWNVAAVQAEFFGVFWGPAGRIAFLLIAGCFLMDTWLAGVDAVSRVHAEMVCTYFPSARAAGVRFFYYLFLIFMTVLTFATIPLAEPDLIVTVTGVLSLFAVAIYATALWLLNVRLLPRRFPAWSGPGPVQRTLFGLVIAFYLTAACCYLGLKVGLL